jgi:hypothetical protein
MESRTFFFLFIYSLFNYSFPTADYVASNGRTSER